MQREELTFEAWSGEVRDWFGRVGAGQCWHTHRVGALPTVGVAAVHFADRPFDKLEPFDQVQCYAVQLWPGGVKFLKGVHELDACPYIGGPAELLYEARMYLAYVCTAASFQAYQALRWLNKFDASDPYLAAAQLVVEAIEPSRSEEEKLSKANRLSAVLLEFFLGKVAEYE